MKNFGKSQKTEIKKIKGKFERSSPIGWIMELIDKDPARAAPVLRRWLHED